MIDTRRMGRRWSQAITPGEGTLRWFWYWLVVAIAVASPDYLRFGESITQAVAFGAALATLWLLFVAQTKSHRRLRDDD